MSVFGGRVRLHGFQCSAQLLRLKRAGAVRGRALQLFQQGNGSEAVQAAAVDQLHARCGKNGKDLDLRCIQLGQKRRKSCLLRGPIRQGRVDRLGRLIQLLCPVGGFSVIGKGTAITITFQADDTMLRDEHERKIGFGLAVRELAGHDDVPVIFAHQLHQRGNELQNVLLGLALCVPTYIISVKRHYPKHERSSWKKRLEVTKDAIWALLMPVILLGGILSGIFTPTEASIVTCVYSLIVGVFVYKEIKLSDVPRIVYTNMRSCSSIIILIGLANVFAFILTNERIPQKVATAILSMTTNRILVILLINLVLIFVGMFMESLAAILITFPVLLPVATAVGMNPVHFALMAILNLMIGLTTPPVGMCICTGAQIGGVSSWKAFKANMPFLITSLIVLMLVSFCEPITLWIPSLFA